MTHPYLNLPLRELRDMPASVVKMKAWREAQPGHWRGRAETRRQMAEQTTGHEQRLHLEQAAIYEKRAEETAANFGGKENG